MDLTGGELFVVGFVLVAVVSFPLWQWLGDRIGSRFETGDPGTVDRAAVPCDATVDPEDLAGRDEA